MTTMWAQGDLVRALQQARLAGTGARRPRRTRAARPGQAVGSLRPVPAR